MLMSVKKGMQMVTCMQKMKKMMRNCATRSIQVIHITLTCTNNINYKKFVPFTVISEMNGRPGNSPVSALLPVYLRCDWIDLLSFMQLTKDCSRVHDV